MVSGQLGGEKLAQRRAHVGCVRASRPSLNGTDRPLPVPTTADAIIGAAAEARAGRRCPRTIVSVGGRRLRVPAQLRRPHQGVRCLGATRARQPAASGRPATLKVHVSSGTYLSLHVVRHAIDLTHGCAMCRSQNLVERHVDASRLHFPSQLQLP